MRIRRSYRTERQAVVRWATAYIDDAQACYDDDSLSEEAYSWLQFAYGLDGAGGMLFSDAQIAQRLAAYEASLPASLCIALQPSPLCPLTHPQEVVMQFDDIPMHPIAHIHTDFSEKFGVPRQSGLVGSLQGEIVFLPPYRSAEAVRGLEGFSHLWLLWVFTETVRPGFSPTVRPPRLGGNARMGVFATRSPFRPNPIGLSCVALDGVEQRADGPVLHVKGADLLDGTPLLDIKPYVPLTDCRPGARGGFAETAAAHALMVDIPPVLLARVPAAKRDALLGVLSQDPRPAYQTDPSRVYGLSFAGLTVRFTVQGHSLRVTEITD